MARTVIRSTPGQGSGAVAGVTQNTLQVEGVRESVEDVVGLISPWETPCFTNFRKVGAKEVIHYWQEDDLEAPSRTNANVQGFEPSTYNVSTPGMKANYLQLFSKTARVATTARLAQFYGRGDEMDYQKLKRGREIRRDIEATLLRETASTGTLLTAPTLTAFNTGNGAVMAPVSRLIHATPGTYASAGMAGNWNVGAGTVIGASTYAGDIAAPLNITTIGANRTLTEAIVLATQLAVFNEGGNPNQLIVTPAHASVVANFAYIDPTGGTSGTRLRDLAGERTVVNAVDLYVSPYGSLAVMIDRFIFGAISGDAESIALLLETDMWFLPELRDIGSEPLAKTGDNDKELVTAELTVGNRHSKCSGLIRDLTN